MNNNNQGPNSQLRSALYIDGFNLYHAIDDLDEPFLKWINYWRLGEVLIPPKTEKIVKVLYCTAFYPNSSTKRWRHEQLINAQKVHGVNVAMGHYSHETVKCFGCDDEWKKPTEKQGDINVAIHLIADGMNDLFDVAYLLSADSDQAATAKMFADIFPKKKLVQVVPPKRNHSLEIARYTSYKVKINTDHLEKCVMGDVVFRPKVANARRPNEYSPPHDWVHPDDRPKR